MPKEADVVSRKMPDGRHMLDPKTKMGLFFVKLLQHRSEHIENFGQRKEKRSVEEVADFLRIKIIEE